MPIGDSFSYTSGSKISALILKYLGALDLHTHLRLKPLLQFLQKHLQPGSSYRVLDIGCGDGINAFELAKIARRKGAAFQYVGVDMNPEHLQKARTLAGSLGPDDCTSFLQIDARNLSAMSMPPFDILILADVVEHVENPQALLQNVRPMLRESASCLVSVPTHHYERIFGKSFHRKVGHVRSGYTLQELDTLFAEIGARRMSHTYTTGLISNLGCAVYYRIPSNNKHVTAAKALLLSPFRVLDLYNGSAVSCSLFAAYSLGH